MTEAVRRKLYLAGPDVFSLRCHAIWDRLRWACEQRDFDGVWPTDGARMTAESIFDKNIRAIAGADGVLANVSPFRGPHCDVGTAWEIGFAYALNKPIFAYSSAKEKLDARVRRDIGGHPFRVNENRDRNGDAIEPFGLHENLMIQESVFEIYADPLTAIDAAVEHFKGVATGSVQ